MDTNDVYGVRLVDEEIRYIGKTGKDLSKRLDEHVVDAYKAQRSHKRNWLKSALDAGAAVEIERLDEAQAGPDLYWLERLWIAVYRACGVPLVNAADGGPGPSGLHQPKKFYPKGRKSRVTTEAFRQTMRAVASARPPMSQAVKLKIAGTKRGTFHRERSKALIGEGMRRWWATSTPEQRVARIRASADGGGFGSLAAAQAGAVARWNKEGISDASRKSGRGN